MARGSWKAPTAALALALFVGLTGARPSLRAQAPASTGAKSG